MKKATPNNMRKNELRDVLRSHGLHAGRLIASSKSAYCRKFPKHLVVFNSKVCSRHQGIVLSGADLDLDLDAEKLTRAAKQAGENFYILPEHKPKMFYNGPLSFKRIFCSAVWWTQIRDEDQDVFQPIGSRLHPIKRVQLVCTVGKAGGKPFYSTTCWDNPLLDSDHMAGAVVDLFGIPPAHFQQQKVSKGTSCPVSTPLSIGRTVKPVFYHRCGEERYVWFNHLQPVPALLYDECLSNLEPLKYTIHQKVQAIHVWQDKRLLGLVWPASFIPAQVVESARAEMGRLRGLCELPSACR
jgi:hypothetical protein